MMQVENLAQKNGHKSCQFLVAIHLLDFPFFFSTSRYQTFIPPPR